MSQHAAHALLIAARSISRAEPSVRPHAKRDDRLVAEVYTSAGYFAGYGPTPTSALIDLLGVLDANEGGF
jgi:hypothetical protein